MQQRVKKKGRRKGASDFELGASLVFELAREWLEALTLKFPKRKFSNIYADKTECE